jgi:hypothetical protein
MDKKEYSEPITGEWLVNDVLKQYPSTRDIFIQHGPVLRSQPGSLFPVYVVVSLREYADSKRLDLGWLLESLNAAVQNERLAPRNPWTRRKRNEIEVSPGIYIRPGDF